jgi:solute carrier family 35 protein E1
MNVRRSKGIEELDFYDDVESVSVSTQSHSNTYSTANSSSHSSTNKVKRDTSHLILPLLVTVWYTTASVSITTSKLVLNALPYPFTLCVSQFVLGAIISKAITLAYPNLGHRHHSVATKDHEPPFLWIVLIAFSYTLGFVFTNTAFNLVNVSFAETIKAAEPISSVLIGFLILSEKNNWQTYASLIPICAGIAISCKGDYGFKLSGFIFALLSNFCFSYRAVLSKHLFKVHGFGVDEMTLFTYISVIGLTLLIPICGYIEGINVIQLVIMNKNIAVFVVPLYLLNGLAYATYNMMSIAVLSRTDLVTHAVLNAFRRVFIIMTTSYFFQVRLSVLNIAGIFVAVAGVVSFAVAKASSGINNSTSR